MKCASFTATALALTAAQQGIAEPDYADLIRSGDIIGGAVASTNEGFGEGAWPGIDFEEEGLDWNRTLARLRTSC